MARRQGLRPRLWRAPLKRVIQKHVQDPLAEMILAGKVMDGETVPVAAGPAGLMIGDTVVAGEKRPAGVMLN